MLDYRHFNSIAIPPLLTSIMVVWVLCGQFLFHHGSLIQLYPLLLLFPLVILSHLYLIVMSSGFKKFDMAFFGLIHGLLSFVVWTFAIMFSNGQSI